MEDTTNHDLSPFRIGPWTVRPGPGIVEDESGAVHLQPKVMLALVVLARHPRKLVSKEDLFASVWEGAAVEEGALTQCIHALRKALRDDARNPRFIETIPRKGYRLIAPVSPLEQPAPARQLKPVVPGSRTAHGRRNRHRSWRFAGGFAALGLVVAWLAVQSLQPPTPATQGSHSDLTQSPTDLQAETLERKPRILVFPAEAPSDPATAATASKTFSVANGVALNLERQLRRSAGLQVCSRSGMRQLRTEFIPPEVAQELGADFGLSFELNSLPRSDHAARFDVELFETVTAEQIWLEVLTLDETLEEQSRRLLARIEDSLGLAPTDGLPLSQNAEALQAYLEGLALFSTPSRGANLEYDKETLDRVVELLEISVEEDPGFTQAWAVLSQVHSFRYFNTEVNSNEKRRALEALEEAEILAPGAVDVHLARVFYHYRVDKDFDAALAALARFDEESFDVHYVEGLILRRKGELGAAIKSLRKAFDLDPGNQNLAGTIAKTYAARRLHETADDWFSNALSIDPDLPQTAGDRAINRLRGTGCEEFTSLEVTSCSTGEARELLNQARPEIERLGFLSFFEFLLTLYEGSLRPPGLERDTQLRLALKVVQPEVLDPRTYEAELDRGDETIDSRKAPNPQDFGSFLWRVVLIHRELGEDIRADEILDDFKAWIEGKVARNSDHYYNVAYLGIARALQGKADEARQWGDEAVRMGRPDRFTGIRLKELRAYIAMILGDEEEALDLLEELLETEYQYAITAVDLRLEPIWWPLHDHPRFRRLLTGPG